MKKFFWVVISLVTVYSILIADGTLGYTFVTPEHYEKIKQQAREKDKNQRNRFRMSPPAKSRSTRRARARPLQGN